MNFNSASVVMENGKLFTWARNRQPETDDESDDTGESRFFMTVLSSDDSASVSDSGDLYVLGDNRYGMLGVGDFDRVLSLTRVPRTLFGGKPVQQVGLGAYHAIVLASGSVFTAGGGACGSLGHGTTDNAREFKRVEALARVPVVFVAAGHTSSAVLAGGRVYTFGRLEASVFCLAPTLLPAYSDSPAVLVSAGMYSMAAVHANNRLYVWGDNASGELGLGDVVARKTPTLVSCKPVVAAVLGLKHLLVLATDGDVYMCGWHWIGIVGAGGYSKTTSVLTRVERLPAAVSVSTGGGQCFAAVTTEGKLYTWDAHKNIEPTLFGLQARVGIYDNAIDTEHILAFAMLLHNRLGQESGLSECPEELVRRVIYKTRSWPAGPVGALDGIARLFGGGAVTRTL